MTDLIGRDEGLADILNGGIMGDDMTCPRHGKQPEAVMSAGYQPKAICPVCCLAAKRFMSGYRGADLWVENIA